MSSDHKPMLNSIVYEGDIVSPLEYEPRADPVIEAYKAGIDITLIRENLRRSPEERVRALQQLQQFAEELRKAGRTKRTSD